MDKQELRHKLELLDNKVHNSDKFRMDQASREAIKAHNSMISTLAEFIGRYMVDGEEDPMVTELIVQRSGLSETVMFEIAGSFSYRSLPWPYRQALTEYEKLYDRGGLEYRAVADEVMNRLQLSQLKICHHCSDFWEEDACELGKLLSFLGLRKWIWKEFRIELVFCVPRAESADQ